MLADASKTTVYKIIAMHISRTLDILIENNLLIICFSALMLLLAVREIKQ